MITAVLKFEISNRFSKRDKSFYIHQPIARPVGIYEIYRGHQRGDEQKVCVLMNAFSEEHIQKFMEANGAAIANSGHILETAVSEIYVN